MELINNKICENKGLIPDLKKKRIIKHKNKEYEYDYIKQDVSLEKRKQYNSTFYSLNKEKKVNCATCNKLLSYYNLSTHNKTATHLRKAKLLN